MDIPWVWIILLVVIVAYFVIVLALYRKKFIGKDKALTLFGPALMIKTAHGKGFLERVANKSPKFWNALGDAGIVLSLASMVAMVVLLLWEAVEVLNIPSSAAPSPSEALALPGINPFIPIGYGLIAIIVGVVLHELSHGVMARANNVKVKSLGVLWLIIPIGAFVEQDEDEMNKAPARKRDRIAAAGVMANFTLALIFLLMLSLVLSTSVQAKADGVGIDAVLPGTPAANLTLAPGDIITSLNGTPTPNVVDLKDALSHTHPGQSVVVGWYSQSLGRETSATAVLAPESAFEQGVTNGSKTAFLGVEEYVLPPQAVTSLLENPFGSAASQSGLSGTGATSTPFLFLALPFIGMEPVQGTPSSFFTVSGPLGALSIPGFWIFVNILYWLCWMNLLLGLSNALPAVPLDGGFIFRDAAMAMVKRFRSSWTEARREAAVTKLAIVATFFIFMLILWQFVAPRL